MSRCAVSGLAVDTGDPLMHGVARTLRGRPVLVCRAVANLLDAGAQDEEVERFVAALVQREAFVAARKR